MCSAAKDALAIRCAHCSQWIASRSPDQKTWQKLADDALERLTRDPRLQERLNKLAVVMGTALADKKREDFAQASREYNLLYYLSNPDLCPGLSAEERSEQAELGTHMAMLMHFDPKISSANKRMSDAVMALATGASNPVQAAQILLDEQTQVQSLMRSQPELREMYAGGPSSEHYARNYLRSVVSTMIQLSATAVAKIYIEVLGAKAITAESNSCPGCMAKLSAAELASAECPYCATSFFLPGAAN